MCSCVHMWGFGLCVFNSNFTPNFFAFQVTVENFIRVLTGRLPPSTPRSKRLLSDERSNVLVYMTGMHV